MIRAFLQIVLWARQLMLVLTFGLFGFLIQQFVYAQIQAEPGVESSYPPSKHGVSEIFFHGPLYGWVLGSENGRAMLFRTTDGGNTWSRTLTRKDFSRVFFLDAQLGWGLCVDEPALGAVRTSLFITHDGGQTWSRQSTIIASRPGHPDMITDFLFVDEKHGWFVGQGTEGGIALETSDEGKSINKINSISKIHHLSHITAPSKDKLWFFGKDTILASFDGGQTWKTQLDDGHKVEGLGTVLLTSGVVRNNGDGWAVGAAPAILSTDDFGQTWRLAFKRQDNWFTDISFWDALHGCAVGASTLLDCTADGGKTWTSRDVLPSRELHKHDIFGRIILTSPSCWWVVSQGGSLFQSKDGGNSWSETNL